MTGAAGEEDVQALAERIDRQLGEIRSAIRRSLDEQYAAGGLTPPQKSLVQVLLRGGPSSVKSLAEALGLAHSTVSVMCDRLVERGVIERGPHPGDGRKTLLQVSAAVTQFQADTAPRLVRDPLAARLAAATSEERRKISEGLSLLLRLVGTGGD